MYIDRKCKITHTPTIPKSSKSLHLKRDHTNALSLSLSFTQTIHTRALIHVMLSLLTC